MKKLFVIISVLSLLCSCSPVNPIVRPVKKTVEYSLGYVQAYGQFYDSVALNVFSLDLYTDGLYLNSKGTMEGSGWNLYLSDIFTSSDRLEPGTYRSDSNALANTFLPGMNFEGMPHGAYILRVDSSSVSQIAVYNNGGFTLEQEGDTTDVFVWFMQKKDTVYKAHYRGKLISKK